MPRQTEPLETLMTDWEDILKRHGAAAWKSAWRVLGNRADADECFQEACLAAFEFSRTHDVRNWRILLQRIANAKAVDRLRLRIRLKPREQQLQDEVVIASDPLPPNQAENSEMAARLRASLGHLPARHAEVFCLYYFDGWTYREIAENLEISTDLAGVWLERARNQLRELLLAGKQTLDEVPHEGS
jgi:RNA polymerase sigma-70 factor (ECF subfamily)